MALSNKTQLLPLLLISLIALTNMVHSQDSTSFTIDTFPVAPTDLTYQGYAHVPSESTFLRLTRTSSSGNPLGGSVGRVLYSPPVQFSDTGRQASFETTIRFLITPVDNSPADGIAFFIAPVGTTIPAASFGGRLGIFGSSGTSSSLFAVEFDTYTNGDASDPNYRHVGIDINSIISRNVTRFDSMVGQQVTARINYEANTRTISAAATVGSETVTVSYEFDLKTILPGQVQVGISSSTGVGVALHDVQAWYFSSTMVSDINNIQQIV